MCRHTHGDGGDGGGSGDVVDGAMEQSVHTHTESAVPANVRSVKRRW
jgi:hypothetical protein